MRPSPLFKLSLVALLLPLAACGGDPTPIPAPMPTAAPAGALGEDASQSKASADAAEADAAAETAEPDATATQAAASPTPPATPTAGPSPTPQPTVTPGPLPKGLPATDAATWPAGNLSPDGKWWVRSVVGEEIAVAGGTVLEDAKPEDAEETWYHRGQQVVATDGSTVHEVLDLWSPFGIGAPSPAVLGWAPDSSWVYLYETGQAGGCGIYPWGRDLLRLAPATGEMQYLQDWMPSAPALSPDGQTLAFASPPRVVLMRPGDGSFLEVWLPGHELGPQQAGELKFDAEGRLDLAFDSNPCSEGWTRGRARIQTITGRAEVVETPAAVR
jgi:hypothetical protein